VLFIAKRTLFLQMLALPIKRSDISNVSHSLEAFLTKEYASDASKFSPDIATFQQLRNSAITASLSSDQIGLQQLLRYNYHIKNVVKRLGGYESETKFTFSWTEAFRPNNRCQSGSLYLDWASVMWNLASFESHKASLLDRATDEGVRSASLHFQQAAGIIEFIRTDLVQKISGPKSPELSDSMLRMVLSLLLGQAQVCFYEKAIRDRKTNSGLKPANIAKLAAQVGAFYWNSVELCRERDVNTTIDPSWIYHLEFQRDSFRALAEYWQSVASKEEALAR
jgi:programmed cell death 6-interacting protein